MHKAAENADIIGRAAKLTPRYTRVFFSKTVAKKLNQDLIYLAKDDFETRYFGIILFFKLK